MGNTVSSSKTKLHSHSQQGSSAPTSPTTLSKPAQAALPHFASSSSSPTSSSSSSSSSSAPKSGDTKSGLSPLQPTRSPAAQRLYDIALSDRDNLERLYYSQSESSKNIVASAMAFLPGGKIDLGRDISIRNGSGLSPPHSHDDLKNLAKSRPNGGLEILQLGSDLTGFKFEQLNPTSRPQSPPLSTSASVSSLSTHVSSVLSGQEVDLYYCPPTQETVPVTINWKQGFANNSNNINKINDEGLQTVSKVFLTGTFTGWTKMIPLVRVETTHDDKCALFTATVNLTPGIHRIRFVVDNELRCSDDLPMATDSMGNFVNYIEVSSKEKEALDFKMNSNGEMYHQMSTSALCSSLDASGTSLKRIPDRSQDKEENYDIHDDDEYKDNDHDIESWSSHNSFGEFKPHVSSVYSCEIPAIFANQTNDTYPQTQPHPKTSAPPGLPPHLDTMILNTSFSKEKEDSSVLPIPNHVILSHLATTSIKNNILAVASINRYKSKFVTQILYTPLQL
ncbi:AMPKBI-domain-containing protein [Nadsonia fulvescens var. elongata DSM 6958]|uniref:AMPKBI-domain-containing protein n=1 Tax=Nadsonia fulvescens var. elongata DSM 6958 TaxID=857566 RepID=A0A1E3PPA9_9ASCO|nr:AMPKBI-domain-containing protein [Nadsonia fulvescens var. elongata DSM 6958]